MWNSLDEYDPNSSLLLPGEMKTLGFSLKLIPLTQALKKRNTMLKMTQHRICSKGLW